MIPKLDSVYVLARRNQTLDRVLDAMYHGAEASAYRQSIGTLGAERVAQRELYMWTVLPEPWAYEKLTDAAIAATQETKAHDIVEITADDLVVYFERQGWDKKEEEK